jgi:hypothetical protein
MAIRPSGLTLSAGVMRTVAKRLLAIRVCCVVSTLRLSYRSPSFQARRFSMKSRFTDVSPLISVLPKVAVGPGTTV